MSELEDNSKPIKSNDLVCREERGFYLVFSFRDGIIHWLNTTAKWILDRCDGQHTIAQIVNELLHEFPSVKKEEILDDVRECVRDLYTRKLLVKAIK